MAFKDLSPEKKMLSAKTELMFRHPFFGVLLCQLHTVEDESVGTMATNGEYLRWAPSFVDKLTKPELVFVLAHECMHNALLHHTRRGSRKPKRWNIAADHAINIDLVASGVGQMPDGGLCDQQYAGLSAEEIYNMLPEGDGGGGGSNDPGGCGGVEDACHPSDADGMKRAEANATIAVKQAAQIAAKKMAGNIPAELQRLIDKALKPIVDWRPILRRFIDENATIMDYAWMRPNRRMLPLGLVLPGQVPDGISHIVIFVDTSGSIDQDALDRFATEINGAFGDGQIDKITVVYADARVCAHEEFERGDPVTLKPAGGGGTAFSDSFSWLEQNAYDASCVIYFTDLFVNDFGQEPHCPVMWAVYGDSRDYDQLVANTPFGEAISLAA